MCKSECYLICSCTNVVRASAKVVKRGVVCRVNITLGPKEERLLMTGLHTVADIYCTCCSTVLGWKYVSVPLPAVPFTS